MEHVSTGLDRICEGEWKKLKGYPVGLLANQASLDSKLNTAREVIEKHLPGQLKALFGPQHGYGGADQDNMVETDHSSDEISNIPIYSLYAGTREPLDHMLDDLDVLIIDLQDVGTRVYTFAPTMLNCLKAAARCGKKVLVLDRPNPLGGDVVEGNLLKPDFYSFVGPYSFPMRHGLTMGEMARVFARMYKLDCDLEIVVMHGWRREMLWGETGLRWIMPSPNMPFADTALVYPGQVIWEGTNLSEGRGTCRPFEIFGAPWLDPAEIRQRLDPVAEKGCYLQEYTFRPTFHKWNGRLCRGFIIHVVDPHVFRPYTTSIALMKTVMDIYRSCFEWKKPPYEYEYKRRPIDLIVGDSSIRHDLESGASLSDITDQWIEDLESYEKWRMPYLLYK
jgi:uncharacterized protein YbbC (DUF1343 family)